MTFADKTTLGQSAVLGILCVTFSLLFDTNELTKDISEGAHINQNQFNWLGTIFYLSYLAFEVCLFSITYFI